jgi:hypothetical protein
MSYGIKAEDVLVFLTLVACAVFLVMQALTARHPLMGVLMFVGALTLLWLPAMVAQEFYSDWKNRR